MSSTEYNSKIEPVSIQIPNNLYYNNNKNVYVNGTGINDIASNNSIHINTHNSYPDNGNISLYHSAHRSTYKRNTQQDQIPNDFNNSFPTLGSSFTNDNTSSQPISINQGKILGNSISSSFQNNSIPDSFESESINNVLYGTNIINHLSESLFSGSLPTENIVINNSVVGEGHTIGSYHEENVPSKTTQYIEGFNTCITNMPAQYFKTHQNFYEPKNTERLQQYSTPHHGNTIVDGSKRENILNVTPTITTPQFNNELSINNYTEKMRPVEQKPLLNIAEFPTEKLLQMLTALLEKIVNSNDELNMSRSNNSTDLYNNTTTTTSTTNTSKAITFEEEEEGLNYSVSCFAGKHIPQISIEQYLLRIQKYCPTTNDIFLSILVYFDRISKKCNNNNNDDNSGINQSGSKQIFVMNSYNIHRLLISAVTVSTKFFSDFFYSNSRYARVGGIPLQEMNKLEIQFLLLCDFKLSIPIDELQRYADLLYTFWNTNNKAKVNNIDLDNSSESNIQYSSS